MLYKRHLITRSRRNRRSENSVASATVELSIKICSVQHAVVSAELKTRPGNLTASAYAPHTQSPHANPVGSIQPAALRGAARRVLSPVKAMKSQIRAQRQTTSAANQKHAIFRSDAVMVHDVDVCSTQFFIRELYSPHTTNLN